MRWYSAVLLIPLFLDAQETHNRLTADEKAAGWQLLFDGTSTRGWSEVTGGPFPTETWRIEEGCLRAIPGDHGHQDIRTERTYRSFELQFSWRILKDGNSGVKYLVQNTDRWTNAQGLQARARGPEYQLVDDASDDAKEPARVTGSLYSVFPPSAHPANTPGEWNASRILVRGKGVEHWLNGQRILTYSLDDTKVVQLLRQHRKGPDITYSTFIALQNHGTPVWFRDLKIRILE
jgi:hypothetical protein